MSFKYVATLITLIFVIIPAEMSAAAPSCKFNEAVSCAGRSDRETCESDNVAVQTVTLNGVPNGGALVSYCIWEPVKVDYQNTPVTLCRTDFATTSRSAYTMTCGKASTEQACRQQSETIRKELPNVLSSKTEVPANICYWDPGL